MRTWTGLAAASVSLVAPVLMIAGTAQAATPVAVWHMEDPGTMTDSSGNNNNGTTAGITSVPGSTGSGYHFESNSSVTVPDSASLNPGTDDFTVTVHVRFDIAPAMGTDYDVIRKGVASTGGGEWKMEIFPNSTLSSPAFCLFKDVNGIAASVRGTTNLAGPDWHTITCAKTSTGVTVTVDGKLQRTNRT